MAVEIAGLDFEKSYIRLVQACSTDDLATFSKYIHQLSTIEFKNEKGWTLLIMAAFAHSYEIVKRLLEMGADVNAANHKGTTVLMYAKTKVKENNNFQFLDFLIEKGANLTATDVAGKNVLDYVKETKDESLVKYFEKQLTAIKNGK